MIKRNLGKKKRSVNTDKHNKQEKLPDRNNIKKSGWKGSRWSEHKIDQELCKQNEPNYEEQRNEKVRERKKSVWGKKKTEARREWSQNMGGKEGSTGAHLHPTPPPRSLPVLQGACVLVRQKQRRGNNRLTALGACVGAARELEAPMYLVNEGSCLCGITCLARLVTGWSW